MSKFSLAEACDESPIAMADRCAAQLKDQGPHNLGFVYVTTHVAGALEEIVDTLREQTKIRTWIGTAGFGVCTTGRSYFGEPAIVAMAGAFPDGSCTLLPTLRDKSDIGAALSAAGNSVLGIVHGDPRNPQASEIIAELSEQSGAYLVGGLTAAEREFPQVAGDVTDGGISGLLLGSDAQISVGLTQGCTPVGPVHRVTRAAANVLITLDDMPAIQALSEDVGIADGVDPLPWLRDIHAAIPISGADTGDYLVRNLMGIDREQGMVVIAERLSAGDRVLFVRRDSESAEKDLHRMIEDIKKRTSFTPKAGLYFSCCARGPNLFDDANHETAAIQEAFGDIPVAGFFGNGEISHNRIYGYTGVLTLFG